MNRPTHTRITKAEYEALAAFRYSLRQFLRFSEDAAKASGLTPRQHQGLLAIKGFPSRDHVTIGEFAEQLQIHHHSAVGLANRLVSKNLARRKQDTADRRQVWLVLAPRGERVLEKLSTMHRDQLHRIAPQIESLLKRIRTKI